MRVIFLIILAFVYTRSSSQELIGKYHDYFGHTLELRNDSTFRFEWRFDLVHNWATGHWKVSGKRISLDFVDIYDTLQRANTPDSLILSNDEISSISSEAEFAQTVLGSGGQYKGRFRNEFYLRGRRLYLVNEKGGLNKRRQRGIWPQKRWLLGYKTWPTYYKKEITK